MWNFLDDLDRSGGYRRSDFFLKLAVENPNEVLGLPECASKDEIRSRFRELALKYHPDVNPDGEEEFKRINSAYQSIMDGKSAGGSNARQSTQENSKKYFSKLLDFLDTDNFIEFYNSDILQKYYRYQTGRVKKKADKDLIVAETAPLRDKLKQLINPVLEIELNAPIVSYQNLLSLIARARAIGHVAASDIRDVVKKYLDAQS